MGHAHAADQTIINPGSLKASTKLMGLFGVCIAIGVIAFLTSLSSDPTRAWASFLAGHFYFLGIAVAGLFFVAIHWITTSMWSAPVLRIAESLTSYLPFVLVTSIILFLGMKNIYIWTDPAHVKGDFVLESKSGFLSQTFFCIRDLLAVCLWIFFARKLVGGSLQSDSGANFKAIYDTNRKFGVTFLALFAITFSMTAFDQLMSLDPHWFSTMFGVYVFAGFYQSVFSTIMIMAILLKRSGYLKQVFNENHQHDLAKWMFAFTVFWAYTWFSQFMLIWYANMPEETGYFIYRLSPAWEPLTIALFMGKFVFPFLALLPRGNKRCENLVLIMAVWILASEYYDLSWIIQAEFPYAAGGMRMGFPEIGTWLGFFGVFGIFVTRFLQKNNVIAIKNPYLPDSAFHHHV